MRHRFHALCPYFAMFPEAFAEQWITRLAKPGQYVLDPFCGRGTAPFQAILMDRAAIGSDINPVAYCVTRAKTNAPTLKYMLERLARLEREYQDVGAPHVRWPEFFDVAFASGTLGQLSFLREALQWRRRAADAMIAAIILGVLHGESQRSARYLSNQMPRTISTKPAYSLRFWRARGLHAPERDAFEVVRRELRFRYASPRPHRKALVFNTDMRGLPRFLSASAPVRCVVTSPPYMDVTSFEEDQWLRLWLLGGPPHPRIGHLSPDDRHGTVDSYWRLISDFWRMLGVVLEEKADIVIRLGAGKLTPGGIADALEGTSVFSGRTVKLRETSVSEIRRRQTPAFRPGASGLAREVDCWFRMQ